MDYAPAVVIEVIDMRIFASILLLCVAVSQTAADSAETSKTQYTNHSRG